MDESRPVQLRVASPIIGLLLAGALTGILWLLIAVLNAGPASAVPARPVVTKFNQPDGTTFRARLYGDEWSNGFETLRGYTVVKNRGNGFWEYAVRRDGKLVASGLRVGKAQPAGTALHLRETLRGRVAEAATDHRGFAKNDTPNVGDQPAIVLLVDYANQVGSTTEAQWNDKFFGPVGTVNHYYDEVTYSSLSFPAATESFGTANNGVVGWLRLPGNHPNTEGNIDQVNRNITKAAIEASDPFVNYATFDTNSNGSIQRNELHITVIVAGHETSYGGEGTSCGNSVWGHNWGLMGSEVPTADGKQVGSDVAGGGYNQFGEKHCWSGDPTDDHIATIGIMVHEMGHDLNLPDLYDTDGGSEGIGEWSVMAGGSWTFTGLNPAGSSPVHPDAFSKWYEGWLTPTAVTGSQTGVQLSEMSTNADVYRLLDNPNDVDWTFQQTPGSGEYFLVENRQLTGYDAALPGCGLLIWHIDETRTASNFANANEARKLVDLEEADGLNHLDTQFNRGDASDPFRGPRFFDATSTPNSNLYSGAASGVTVNNISSACAATMTADMTVASTTFGLTVAKTGTGTGVVESFPAGIDCGGDCTQVFSSGTVVTLTATPSGGSKFTSWSGDCSGADDTCLVTMDAARSVTASFTGPTTTTLSISKTQSKIKATGSVQPGHPGDQVQMTLYKRRANGTWRKFATKTDVLNSSSVYAKSFSRPSSGRCKMTSKFASDGDHLGSKSTKQFRC